MHALKAASTLPRRARKLCRGRDGVLKPGLSAVNGRAGRGQRRSEPDISSRGVRRGAVRARDAVLPPLVPG